MSDFVNQIKTKDGSLYDIQDKRVDGIKTAEGKLHVEKVEVPVGPVPVAEFDGVKYYHKHEFDLEEILSLSNTQNFNILTGEEYEVTPESVSFTEYSNPYGDWKFFRFVLKNDGLQSLYIYNSNGSDYISRAFTVVHQISDVTDKTKICLPENATAYYGYLSDDHKTFISYWNEGEGDTEVKPVSKITDGKTEVEIHDARLNVTSEDIGKVVGVNDNGELALVNASSGGTKLYKHNIILSQSTMYPSNAIYVELVTTKNVALTFTDIRKILSYEDGHEYVVSCLLKSTGELTVLNAFGNDTTITVTYIDELDNMLIKQRDYSYIYESDTVTEL